MIDKDRIAKEIAERMINIVERNTKLFIECEKTFEFLFESQFNRLAGNGLPEIQYEPLYNELSNHMEVLMAITIINGMIHDYLEEHAPVHVTEADRLRYYALSQADFVEMR